MATTQGTTTNEPGMVPTFTFELHGEFRTFVLQDDALALVRDERKIVLDEIESSKKMAAKMEAAVAEARETLLDRFAMAAMTGDMSRSDGIWANKPDEDAARTYYSMAQAMSEARKLAQTK